ncbi:hypothetical protein [Vibrio owensii]|uniref:hypothetical protein n=1 Tax=Vibrio owensii TaxID=696485 RepID=UPI0018F2342B|nr:hypothetical protein [Vibrio owensii]
MYDLSLKGSNTLRKKAGALEARTLRDSILMGFFVPFCDDSLESGRWGFGAQEHCEHYISVSHDDEKASINILLDKKTMFATSKVRERGCAGEMFVCTRLYTDDLLNMGIDVPFNVEYVPGTVEDDTFQCYVSIQIEDLAVNTNKVRAIALLLNNHTELEGVC